MARRRWIADRTSEERAWITGDNAAHLTRVLRASVGQQFEIAADGVVRLGTITRVSEKEVEFALVEAVGEAPVTSTTLLLAVFKFDRLEWGIEKAAEFGVTRIVPVIARRTDAHLASAAAKRVERWRRIVREAAQQSRQAGVAEVEEPRRLREMKLEGGGARILLSENERQVRLLEALGDASAQVTLAVGPEGGWAQEEFAMFDAAGWKPATLGPSILRAETAVIAALAVVAQARLRRESARQS